MKRFSLVLGCLLGLAGCATQPPGPRVAIMPTAGKPLELFAAEDQYCRGYAQQSIGQSTSASNEAAVGSAVVGTVVGAAVGSMMSTRRHDTTAAGAATGLAMGTAVGAGQSAAGGESAQRRYDIAYEQCMLTRNNLTPRNNYRQMTPESGYYPPPPPPHYYPPPPPPPPSAR